MFGADGIEACNELFAHPSQVLARARRGVLATGLERVFTKAEPFLARELALQGQLSLESDRIQQAAEAALEDSIPAISDQLDGYDPAQTDDIRHPERQKTFKNDLYQQIIILLDTGEPQDPLSKLRKRLETVDRLKEQAEIKQLLNGLKDGISAKPDADRQKLLRQLVAGLQESIQRRIAEPLLLQMESMLMLLRKASQADDGSQIRAVEQNIVALLETVLKSNELVIISRIGQEIQDMCDSVTQVAKSAFDVLLGDSKKVTKTVDEFQEAVLELEISNEDAFDSARRAQGRLVKIADRIKEEIIQLNDSRAELARKEDSICEDQRGWLALLTNISQHKRLIAEELYQASMDLEILQQKADIPSPYDSSLVRQAVGLASDIQLQLTGIAAMADRSNLQQFRETISMIPDDAKIRSAFAGRLEGAMARVHKNAKDLKSKLDEHNSDASKLKYVSGCVLNEFNKVFEQELAGSILQTVAFPDSLVRAIDESLISPLATTLVGPVNTLYETAGKATTTFIKPVLEFGQLEKTNDTGQLAIKDETMFLLAAIYRFVLGVEDADAFKFNYAEPIKSLQRELPDEMHKIMTQLENAEPQNIECIAELFNKGPNGSPPASKLLALFGHIRALARFESGEALVADLRDMLIDVDKRLRDFATQFVPTTLTTSYKWDAKLKKFPKR